MRIAFPDGLNKPPVLDALRLITRSDSQALIDFGLALVRGRRVSVDGREYEDALEIKTGEKLTKVLSKAADEASKPLERLRDDSGSSNPIAAYHNEQSGVHPLIGLYYRYLERYRVVPIDIEDLVGGVLMIIADNRTAHDQMEARRG